MSTPAVARNVVGKLSPASAALLLCDMQERFQPLIWHMTTVVQTAQCMTSVAAALDMPIVATQQCTKVFGDALPACFATGEIQAAT